MPLCFLPSGWDVRFSALLITTSIKPSSDHFLSILPSFSCSGCFVTVFCLCLIVSLLCHSLLALTDCISEGRASWWWRLGRCTKTLGDFTSYHFRLFVSVTKYLTRSKLKGGMRGGDGGSCGLQLEVIPSVTVGKAWSQEHWVPLHLQSGTRTDRK